ncbi:hypothetical protein [Eudoraea chungangensis]|uniref:hypothetical protein n=1 Tax=Eudoraea chungangensis TaxID=1481905 RepID=UPI0023EE0145|nr:hypothetical protein [Eudoraea chungangensis]
MNIENTIDALFWIDQIAATVWIILSLIMFWILYQLYALESKEHPVFKFGVFLLVLVWLYPVYTFLFNQIEVGFAGNLLTLWATSHYILKLKKLAFKQYLLLLPQIVWLLVATFYVGCLLAEKYMMA